MQSTTVSPRDKWVTMSVHGFENSIISWRNRAHSSLIGGENYYTIVGTFNANSQSIDPDAMDTSESEHTQTGPAASFLSFEVVGSQDEHS